MLFVKKFFLDTINIFERFIAAAAAAALTYILDPVNLPRTAGSFNLQIEKSRKIFIIFNLHDKKILTYKKV